MCIYVCICVYMCVYVRIYVYIYMVGISVQYQRWRNIKLGYYISCILLFKKNNLALLLHPKK